LPDQKAQLLTINAAERKKQQKLLSTEQKGQVMTINAAAHKKQYLPQLRRAPNRL
jgi:hypothetical protein